MSSAIVALHLGALHPYEKALTLLLAFGPFVVLGLVIAVRRRQDLAEDRAQEEKQEQVGTDQGISEPATPGRPGSPSSTP